MKKFLCLLLSLTLCMSVISACGKKESSVTEKPQPDTAVTEENIENNTEENQAAQPNTSSENEDTNADAPSNAEETTPPVSAPETPTNEEVVTSDTAPDVYLVVGGDESVNICYHLKDCSLVSGLTTQKMSWAMVEAMQFRHCPTCNPPRYEGYIE